MRPEHIELPSKQDGGRLVVETLEMLGADNLVHGRLGGIPLVVRLPHSLRPPMGSNLWLYLPPRSLHFFDENQQRIE
ncbi:glycerol-3-phosphate ABC transporter ATP-binding protein [Erwinia pyrifoliae]|nr:glycerol-3-phosphate ABC transporter ATP-binding protein [Erwinia pyrifoliae]MCA8875064.1 TOBE domain-containing protein [Erwinia pyrifoliae]